MKNVAMRSAMAVVTAAVLSLCGCGGIPTTTDTPRESVDVVATGSVEGSPAVSLLPTEGPSVSVRPEQPMLQLKDITVDDQKQVETLIKTYFERLENKNYKDTWTLLSATQQDSYPLKEAEKSHWGIEAIHLVSMKGILPPYIAQTLPPYEADVMEVPPDTATVWFEVELDITPSSNTAWEQGTNIRFVMPVKDGDGTWKIDGLATSP